MALGREGRVADLADGVVEVFEGFIDALPGGLWEQASSGLQADPHAEEAGNDRVEQFPGAASVLGCAGGAGQASGVFGPPGHGEVAYGGESEVAGRAGDRVEADLGQEGGPILAQPHERPPGVNRPVRRCPRVLGTAAAVGHLLPGRDERLDLVAEQLAVLVAEHLLQRRAGQFDRAVGVGQHRPISERMGQFRHRRGAGCPVSARWPGCLDWAACPPDAAGQGLGAVSRPGRPGHLSGRHR